MRHETLQKFMLANDSVTVAIEIPIWLTDDDIAALERQHGIELGRRVGNAPRVITGHIDFLQVRNGAVHILDYKPDAPTNKPIAQLAIYALVNQAHLISKSLSPGMRRVSAGWLSLKEAERYTRGQRGKNSPSAGWDCWSRSNQERKVSNLGGASV